MQKAFRSSASMRAATMTNHIEELGRQTARRVGAGVNYSRTVQERNRAVRACFGSRDPDGDAADSRERAAFLKEARRYEGKRAVVILCGRNVSRAVMLRL